ncbi:hypothetical protein VIAQ111709_12120 [Vibrio aquimaris]|uniref:Uncharacterized protein n=1 Tax=Vibrio aquimaris TaxID=2587862 RepID=A0A5P9CRD4_9VIBR|nr:hypothetical protein FIV01_19225 [Vibrio aquimaris]
MNKVKNRPQDQILALISRWKVLPVKPFIKMYLKFNKIKI